MKVYPKLKIEDLEVVIESMDQTRDGKIDIDEFIASMHSDPTILEAKSTSRQYKAILSLKAQRRFLPNDFMKYFEKIAESALYIPSFITNLHMQNKNLPSESFRLTRDENTIWFKDIKPVMEGQSKPTKHMKEIDPLIGGYIIMNGATGIPIPSEGILKRENIVNRVVKLGYFDTISNKFIYGTALLHAEWDQESEDIWSFNAAKALGTNPIVFKWVDKSTLPNIDVIFEFISTIKYFLYTV